MKIKTSVKNFLADKRNQKYLIILYFLLLSVVMFWPMRNMLYLYRGQDIKFHVGRIEELFNHLKNGGFFVYLSTYSANKIGIATNVFYPDLFIYLFAGLKFIIHNPIKAIYVGVWLINLAGLYSSYFSFKALTKSNLKAFLFANIFGLSTYRYTDILWRFDLGEYLALVFVPIILVSFYKLIYERAYRYWPVLTLSMAAVLYSHIMTIMIITVLLLVTFLVSLPKLKNLKATFIHLVYAGLAFFVLALGYLIPFASFYFANPIKHPELTFTFMDSAYLPSQLFNATLNNQLVRPFNLGFISLVLFALAIFNFRKLKPLYRILLILALVFLFVSTRIFPWSLVPEDIMAILQFPYRFLFLADVFMAAVGAEVVSEFTSKKFVTGLTIFMLTLSLASVYHFLDFQNKGYDLIKESVTLGTHPVKMTPEQKKKTPPVYNLKMYQTNLIENGTRYGYSDYIPQQMKLDESANTHNLRQNIAHFYHINGQKKVVKHLTSIPNGVKYVIKTKNAGTAVLPFYLYDYTHYLVKVNGQKQAVKSDKFYNLKVNLKKGTNQIMVKYIPSFMEIAAVFISWLGFIGVCAYQIFLLKKKY